MFTADIMIDTIKTAKLGAVKTFVQNEAIAKTLTDLVNTEASIAKDVAKANTDAFTTIGQEMVKLGKEHSEKFAKGEYFKEWTKHFEPKSAK